MTVYYLSLETIRRLIEESGYIPRQRNVFYEYIDDFDGAESSNGADKAGSALSNATI